jgi:undecaprenyl-diphosphatase
MLQELILFVQDFIAEYGLLGTFIISILESFIFPIPTATIIAPTTAFGLDPFWVTIIAVIGSVLGALIGYVLGYYLGHPVAERLFKKHIKRVEHWFDKYGAWAVFIAAFSPIPFKVFTWSAGIFRMDLKHFILASIAGRILQFIIVAYAGSIFGLWFLTILSGL